MSEELQAIGRSKVLALLFGRGFLINHLWPEGVVEIIRPESAGVDRPRHEFPERLQILGLGLVGIVKMRGPIIPIGGWPHPFWALVPPSERDKFRWCRCS